MSIKIYFDMDGVLADFDAAAAVFNVGEHRRHNLNRGGKFLGADAAQAKRDRWKRIENERGFWANIPVMAGADGMLGVAVQVGELFVLTSVPNAKNFAGGAAYVDFVESEKRAWIAKYMPNFFDAKNVIVTRIAKDKLINPTQNDILIDDRADNVADWLAAGGRAIIYTSPVQVIKDLTLMNL